MLGERLHSYEEILENARRFAPGQPVRTNLILRTSDTANRQAVEREALAFTEGAIALGMRCTSLPDPTTRRPEYMVLIAIEGPPDLFIGLMDYMIRRRTPRAR
jgi:hypothetical protein